MDDPPSPASRRLAKACRRRRRRLLPPFLQIVPTDQDLVAPTLVGDGSASRLPILDLKHAVFAIVFLSDAGTPTLIMQAPVWRSLPQTAQAAEHAMVVAAQELAGEKAVLYSDCLNVVRKPAGQRHSNSERKRRMRV